MPSPQKVEIQNMPSANSEDCVNYVNPFDFVPISTEYSFPFGQASPPKPPRAARKFKNGINIDKQNIELLPKVIICFSFYDSFNFSQTFQETSASQLTNAPQILFSSIDEVDEGLSKVTQLLQPEPVYAKITPKKLRQSASSTTSQSSSPVPKSDNESPASSKTSLTEHFYSQDFIPKVTSSRNDILEPDTKEFFRNCCLEDNVPKDKEDQSLSKSAVEKKFVANLFESRPSKKWEKLVRNSSFQKRTFVRMSLDSKILLRKNVETDDSKSLARMNTSIEKLGRGSNKLRVETNVSTYIFF